MCDLRQTRIKRSRTAGDRSLKTAFLTIVLGCAVLLAGIPVRALDKYVDELPRPAVMKPAVTFGGIPFYVIPMTACQQKLHRDLAPTKLFGYNGLYPGPTIEARSYDPLYITWINNLPDQHILPIDHMIHGAEEKWADVRTVTHLHGGHVPAASDGYPEYWFTNSSLAKPNGLGGPAGNTATYFYPNAQDATTLWYHDHALGITRLNVMAGLAAFYLIRNANEDKLNLPKGKYEIPLAIQDRTVDLDPSSPTYSQLQYPAMWEPEFFGDQMLVNGKMWPFVNVEARKYRFRILNGCNSRFLRITLYRNDGSLAFDPTAGTWSGTAGPIFNQIGNEGGLFQAPVKLPTILLGGAERADVIVDFSTLLPGDEVIMTNDAVTPFPTGDPVTQDTGQVMKFVVVAATGRDTSVIPKKLRTIKFFKPAQADATRDHVLVEIPNTMQPGMGGVVPTIDGLFWDDPVTEKPRLNNIEMWQVANLTPDTHPIHLHLVQFQVVNRQQFRKTDYLAEWLAAKAGGLPLPKINDFLLGSPIPPDDNEKAWKDTVRMNTDQVTRIIMRFEDYSGKYVWHCHILEHEENEMMRKMNVLP